MSKKQNVEERHRLLKKCQITIRFGSFQYQSSSPWMKSIKHANQQSLAYNYSPITAPAPI